MPREAGIDGARQQETAERQSGANEQHQGCGDLAAWSGSIPSTASQ
jgi:hypothetical protein